MKQYKVWYKETQVRLMSCIVEAEDQIEADRLAHEEGFNEEEILSCEETETQIVAVDNLNEIMFY